MKIAIVPKHLRQLAKLDPERKIFGSGAYDYELEPPVSLDVVEKFEHDNELMLPADYRYFLLRVGNGGAGPAYGVFPFGQHDDGFELVDWQDHFVGDCSKPFAHEHAWNMQEPEFEYEDLDEAEIKIRNDFEAIYFGCEVMTGAIPICHLGCARRHWLVVNGPQAGYVWNDGRAEREGISPLLNATRGQMTFTDWYMEWIADCYSKLGRAVPAEVSGV